MKSCWTPWVFGKEWRINHLRDCCVKRGETPYALHTAWKNITYRSLVKRVLNTVWMAYSVEDRPHIEMCFTHFIWIRKINKKIKSNKCKKRGHLRRNCKESRLKLSKKNKWRRTSPTGRKLTPNMRNDGAWKSGGSSLASTHIHGLLCFSLVGFAEFTCHEQLWTRCYVYGLLCTKPGRGSAHG